MARALAMAGLLAAVAAVGFLTGGASPGSRDTPAAAQQRLIALDEYFKRRGMVEATRVVELDPATFFRRPGRELKLPDGARSRALGPDGGTLAIGGHNLGEIMLVDLARLTLTGVVRLVSRPRGEFFGVDILSWPRADRLLAAVSRAQSAHSVALPPRLVLVDPLRRKVLRAIRLPGAVTAWARSRGSVVFLLAPVGRVGAARLVVVSPDGHLRAVTLTRIRTGRSRAAHPHRVARSPALVADGRRAVVVGAFEPVASVDLRTLAVSYHAVPRLMKPHLPVAPASRTGSAGPQLASRRSATWLGRDRLIVTGRDEYPARGGRSRVVTRAASIVDTDAWRVRHVFRRIARLEPARGLLFGSGAWNGRRMIGPSLAVFRPDGALVHRDERPNLWWDLVVGRLVAGRSDGSALAELNPRTGKPVRRLEDEASVWCCDVFAWPR